MIEVVAIALVDPRGRVLMQRRPPGKAHAGLWEFPGGKRESGESRETALCREVAEELGLLVREADLGCLAQAQDPAAGIVIWLYICREWLGEPTCLDAEELGWFAPAALCALAMPPLDVPLAGALRDVLEQAN